MTTETKYTVITKWLNEIIKGNGSKHYTAHCKIQSEWGVSVNRQTIDYHVMCETVDGDMDSYDYYELEITSTKPKPEYFPNQAAAVKQLDECIKEFLDKQIVKTTTISIP